MNHKYAKTMIQRRLDWLLGESVWFKDDAKKKYGNRDEITKRMDEIESEINDLKGSLEILENRRNFPIDIDLIIEFILQQSIEWKDNIEVDDREWKELIDVIVGLLRGEIRLKAVVEKRVVIDEGDDGNGYAEQLDESLVWDGVSI